MVLKNKNMKNLLLEKIKWICICSNERSVSVTFWARTGSFDPYTGLRIQIWICIPTLVRILPFSSVALQNQPNIGLQKISSHKSSHKTVKINVFLLILPPDPDPCLDPHKYLRIRESQNGSYRSVSGSRTLRSMGIQITTMVLTEWFAYFRLSDWQWTRTRQEILGGPWWWRRGGTVTWPGPERLERWTSTTVAQEEDHPCLLSRVRIHIVSDSVL